MKKYSSIISTFEDHWERSDQFNRTLMADNILRHSAKLEYILSKIDEESIHCPVCRGFEDHRDDCKLANALESFKRTPDDIKGRFAMKLPVIGRCAFQWKPTWHASFLDIMDSKKGRPRCFHWLGWYIDFGCE